MVLKLVYRLWEGGTRWINPDPADWSARPDAEFSAGESALPLSGPEDSRRRQRAQEAAQQRRRLERTEQEDRASQKDGEAGIDTLVLSDAGRRQYEDLARDISDAIRIARIAYEQALIDQQEAAQALDEARAEALVLPDGRRVYFTEDGSRLYDEDGNEITDEALIAAARLLHEQNPNATTHETYVGREQDFSTATARVEEIERILQELEDLDERFRNGEITPEELAHRRQELDRIVRAMPPEVRAAYHRMQQVEREEVQPSYRAADPSFTSGPNIQKHFAESHTPELSEQPDSEDIPDRTPAYRSAPDF